MDRYILVEEQPESYGLSKVTYYSSKDTLMEAMQSKDVKHCRVFGATHEVKFREQPRVVEER